MVRSIFIVGLALVQGCSSDPSTQGELGGHCYPNGTCNVGLSCHAGTCEPADAAVPDAIDASLIDAPVELQCADDSLLEGGTRNDTVATASSTPVAATQSSITFAGLAICPSGDLDLYRVDITTAGQNVTAEVEYDASALGGVPLQLSILNKDGTTIAHGSPMGVNRIGATVTTLPITSSPYYAQVYGPVSGKNNYKLFLEVTGP